MPARYRGPINTEALDDVVVDLLTHARTVYQRHRYVAEMVVAINLDMRTRPLVNINPIHSGGLPTDLIARILTEQHAVAAAWTGQVPCRALDHTLVGGQDVLATGCVWPAGRYRATRAVLITRQSDGSLCFPIHTVPRPYRWLDWLDTAVQAAQRPAIPNPRTAPKKNRSSSHAA